MKMSLFTVAFLMIMAMTTIDAQNTRILPPVQEPNKTFYMPAEEAPHEGTWIQWPHNYGWDTRHIARYEPSWLKMTEALHVGEKVHIVCYDSQQKTRINTLLTSRNINLAQITYHIWPTNDVWIRDNGPIFTYNQSNTLVVQDWAFNGWGSKAAYLLDDTIPTKVATYSKMQAISIPLVNEGGSVEVDGYGTLMAKRSSILNTNRNPGVTQFQAESYFRKYLGVTNFIWLNGIKGGDITDDHIDGTARFGPNNTIVTFARSDFVTPTEYDVLKLAKNTKGQTYKIVTLPLTTNIVSGVNDYGIYINYYVGNKVVIVPTLNDPSDSSAIAILKQVYPTRTMVGINFVELYKDGGLVHCVTQQQPVTVRPTSAGIGKM